MSMHSLPSALPRLGVSLGAGSPTPPAAGPGSLDKGPGACAGAELSLTQLKSAPLGVSWDDLDLQRTFQAGLLSFLPHLAEPSQPNLHGKERWSRLGEHHLPCH